MQFVLPLGGDVERLCTVPIVWNKHGSGSTAYRLEKLHQIDFVFRTTVARGSKEL